MTTTYAILKVSDAAFKEIESALMSAGYADQFHEHEDGLLINMYGIAVQAKKKIPFCSLCNRTELVRCLCGALWCDNHPLLGTTCPVCGLKEQ